MKETILYQNGQPVAIAPSCEVRENPNQYWKISNREEITEFRAAGLRNA